MGSSISVMRVVRLFVFDNMPIVALMKDWMILLWHMAVQGIKPIVEIKEIVQGRVNWVIATSVKGC
jgi:hypothetical protein